ncbi:Saccharopine dehydrogenase protein [Rutstroemia sp. NJR-2017a WRK4]|nr:Saccharopine dehydrogenase protein [Rutstroemia sp. NJR-2017a WRK4]
MSTSNRQYELVIFGATGYTGKLAAEHVATHLPTDLRWALAGRSASKLEAVAAECKELNPNRIQPGIEVCNLDDAELSALAKKTKLILATVGPYALHGERCFKACAENGTHYIDVTGEVPWVADMIRKYEKTAKENGSIMIPQCGIESAPPDLVTRVLVDTIREKYSAPTGEVVVSLHELSSKPSGGTLATVFTLLDVYSLKEVGASMEPYALSPIPAPKVRDSTSFFSRLLTKLVGIKVVPDLGILTTSIAGRTDLPIIHRSWGMLGGADFYGPNFHVSEYMKARNYLTAIALHFGLLIGGMVLCIPLFRRVMSKYVYQPGEGATKEQYKRDRVEYRAIAKPDLGKPKTPRVFCRAHFEGSAYALTGILLAQGAMTILRDNHELSGGVYTPASLGQKFVDRLEEGGMRFEKKFYEE